MLYVRLVQAIILVLFGPQVVGAYLPPIMADGSPGTIVDPQTAGWLVALLGALPMILELIKNALTKKKANTVLVP